MQRSKIDAYYKKSVTFDVAMLQENITVGHRIEMFAIEYLDHGKWKALTEGTR